MIKILPGKNTFHISPHGKLQGLQGNSDGIFVYFCEVFPDTRLISLFLNPMAKINNTIQIDIHGMTVDEALKLLREQVKNAPRWIEKIVVVHGYNRGTALKEAIPKLRNPRIKEIAPSFLNDGETVIWLCC